MIEKIKHRIKRLKNPKFKPANFPDKVTIGTDYGGWTIPRKLFNKNSTCFLAGAGEDISFDIGLVKLFGCDVHIFDPTPRAKTHFDWMVNKINNGLSATIYNNYSYEINKNELCKLHFHQIGIWDKSEELKFYAPKNKDHVSHSIVNLQKTEDYFLAKVDRLLNIMNKLAIKELDLLKIDIEGAEYKVLQTIIQDEIKIKVICVEFDEAFNSLDNLYSERIKNAVNEICDYGYKIIDTSIDQNYTFIRNDIYKNSML